MKKSTPQQDRVRGFRDAIKDYGKEDITYDVFYGDQTSELGKQFADRIMLHPSSYTAVFAPSCPIASGLVTRLRNNDYEVPKNISVICFDDSMLIDERGLNLTTISYNPYQMGIYAAETLIRRIENRNGGCYRLLLEPKILDIHSVAPPLSQSDK